MSKWVLQKAAEFCASVRDGTHDSPKSVEGGGKPLVTSKVVKQGVVRVEDAYLISEKDYRKINERSKVDRWDILMTMIGTVGECAIVKDDPDYAIKNIALFKMAGDEEKSKWLYYYLTSPTGQGALRGNFRGSSQQYISLDQLRNLEVPVPEKDVRSRIVAILSDYDSAIDNARRQIALLEEAAMRLYREWFGDGRQEKVLLVDVASVTYGFPFVGKLFNDKGLGLPIIRIRNVPEGLSKDFTTEKAPDRYIVKDGDILIGMDGEFYVNFWSGGDAYLVQRTCRLRPNDAHMFGFVLEAIKGPIRAFQSAIVGSTVGHLGKKDIDTITIPIPNDKKIVDLLQDGFEQRLTLMKQICSLTEARDRLLPKLMSGEIEV